MTLQGKGPATTDDFRALGLLPSEGSATKRLHGNDAFPQLNVSVYLVGSCFEIGAVQMFAKAGCTQAKSLEEAELVCYLGGEDIDPGLYGERPLSFTYCNPKRDEREVDIFAKCVELDKPMFGICRGMQLLHALNGGKLYQHVQKHTYTHKIQTYDNRLITASSMHHQMCIVDDNCYPLAYAANKGHSGEYHSFGKTIMDPNHDDLEAAVYPNIRAIAVQGHPEVGGYAEYTAWCLEQVREFLNDKQLMGDNIRSITEVPFINKGVRDV